MGKKFNYGYIVIIACFTLAFFYLGLGNITQNLYVVPVTEHFNFSRSKFSLIFSIIGVIGIFANLFYYMIYERLGIRFIVGVGTLSFGIGYFTYYKACTLTAFYIGGILIGIGMVFTSTLTYSILINSWFTKNKGLILGLIFAGSGLGGALFSPIVANTIFKHGFKRSYLISSIIFFLLSIPTTLLIKEPQVSISKLETAKSENIMDSRKSTAELIREPSIAIALFCLFMFGFLIAPLLHITPAHMTDRNYDFIFASEISGAVMLILAFAKVFLGTINDRFGIKVSMSIGLITFIFSALLLLFMTGKLIAWIYSITYGIALATLSVLIPLFVIEVVKGEYFSKIIGLAVSLMSAGAAAGTPVINFSYDLTGHYNFALAIFAVLGIVTYLLTLLSLNKSSKNVNSIS